MSSLVVRPGPRGTRYLVRYRHHGVQRAATFTEAAAAERWRTVLDAAGPEVALSLLDQAPAADHLRRGLTVAAWLDEHVTSLTGVTEGTRATYRAMVRDDITPALGALPLAGLTRAGVASWVNALAAAGAAGKTVANKHALLSAAMNAAVREGHLAANPCRGIRLPDTSHESAEMTVLSPTQQEALLAELAEPYRTLVLVLLRTGLRFGEATALPARGLHLQQAVPFLRVTQAWKKTGGGARELGPPKSARSRRTVTLDDRTAAALAAAAAGRSGGDLVLTAPRGGPVWHGAFMRAWTPAVHRAGLLPAPRVHDLRHTHASALIAAGVPLTHLQRRLGHESVKTTSDRYGHLTQDAHEAMAAALAAAFGA